MDLQMSSSTETTPTAFSTWDFDVQNGSVALISGDLADVQAASMAAFLQVGTIPQLPDVGVPWVEFLTGQATFGDIDAAIRKAAFTANVSNFAPQYDFENGRLTVTMTATKRTS